MFRSKLSAILLAAALALLAAGCGEQEAESVSNDEVVDSDFCQEHQIAESRCPFCNPGLIESLGFCGGHGVPEAFCYQCSPDLILAFKAIGDWCGGHDRPESQCYICNPELDPDRVDHSQPEPIAPVKGHTRRQQAPSLRCSTAELVVRLDSPEVAENAGFMTSVAKYRQVSQTIECNAEIAYDGNRYARLSSQVPGVVAALHKEPGDHVEPGDALVTITSAHLGTAKAAYRQAATAVELWERNHARETDLMARGVATEKDLIEADIRLAESRIALGEAEQSLLSLGISDKQIQDILRTTDTSSAYTVTASISGVIVERSTALGEVVEPAHSLFAVADVSRMWAFIEVYEADLRWVETGQPVVLQVEGLPGEPVSGLITWVSSQLDPRTRTLRARVEIPNEDGHLLAHMYARAVVTVADGQQTLVVPESAVQWEGCCNIVFVRKSETVFEPRKVQLGMATGTVYEVLRGIEAGDEVVTEGSYLLKTEILKGSIGAGCCEVEPGT